MIKNNQPTIYLNKNDFEQLLQKRIFEYADVMGSPLRQHMVSTCQCHSNAIRRLDFQFDLFGDSFWGYGVNYICNGKEEYSNNEIAEVKKINELNKHQKYSWLWVLIFKIENDSFVYSIFGMDTCRADQFNSGILKKIPLSNIKDVTIKTKGQRVFIEIDFKELEKPFSFEVDKYHYRNNNPETLAKYYRDNILLRIPQKANAELRENTLEEKIENKLLANIDRERNQAEEKNRETKKIFISHSSADKEKIGPLVNLIINIGVKHNQIFYSSHPGYGVDLGENIFERLKKELNDDVIVLFVLSENFYSSEVCLCEMGAAWIKSHKQIPMLIPPFDFKDVKGVFPDTLGLKINDKDRLNSFKTELDKHFNLEPIHGSIWENKRDEFLAKIDVDLANDKSKLDNRLVQRKELITPSKIYYQILNNASKKVLCASPDDKQVEVWTAEGGDNQMWEICNVGINLYSIHSKQSGKCLEVKNGSAENRSSIELGSYRGIKSQHWEIVSDSGESCIIKTHSSGMCLEANAKTVDNDGGEIIQHEINNGEHQKWVFQASIIST